MQQPVQRHVLVDHDDDPERHLKRTLGVLVPEELLREQGARPATEQCEQMQRALRRAPTGFDRALLVPRINRKRHDGHAAQPARAPRSPRRRHPQPQREGREQHRHGEQQQGLGGIPGRRHGLSFNHRWTQIDTDLCVETTEPVRP